MGGVPLLEIRCELEKVKVVYGKMVLDPDIGKSNVGIVNHMKMS